VVKTYKTYLITGGAVGYSLVLLFFVAYPYEHTLKTLYFVCPICPTIETVGPTWPVYLLLFAPLNAVTYGVISLLVAKMISVVVSSVRHQRQTGDAPHRK